MEVFNSIYAEVVVVSELGYMEIVCCSRAENIFLSNMGVQGVQSRIRKGKRKCRGRREKGGGEGSRVV